MRILHLTDLHGRRAWYRWLIHAAVSYELICLTGDLIDHERDVPYVRRALRRLRAPLALCSGNHDDCLDLNSLRAERTEPTWVDGERFDFGGAQFRSLGWGEPLPRGKVVEVWLTHAPPRGTGTAWTRHGIDFGDAEFRDVCAAGAGPAIALTGHVHEPAAHCARIGRTLVLNPGWAGESKLPNFEMLDFKRGAVRHSAAERVTDLPEFKSASAFSG